MAASGKGEGQIRDCEGYDDEDERRCQEQCARPAAEERPLRPRVFVCLRQVMIARAPVSAAT
jgi:hypothetical protein